MVITISLNHDKLINKKRLGRWHPSCDLLPLRWNPTVALACSLLPWTWVGPADRSWHTVLWGKNSDLASHYTSFKWWNANPINSQLEELSYLHWTTALSKVKPGQSWCHVLIRFCPWPAKDRQQLKSSLLSVVNRCEAWHQKIKYPSPISIFYICSEPGWHNM